MTEPTPSGKLFNRRIAIQSPGTTPDATGFVAYGTSAAEGTWIAVLTCWAAILPGDGNEVRQSDREIDKSPVMIYIRFSSLANTVTASMRGVDQVYGTIYDIRDVSNVEQSRRLIQLTCRVVT